MHRWKTITLQNSIRLFQKLRFHNISIKFDKVEIFRVEPRTSDKPSNEDFFEEILFTPSTISIFIGFSSSVCHFVANFTGFLMHFELLKSDKYWYDWWYQKYCVFYLFIRWLVIRCRSGILNDAKKRRFVMSQFFNALRTFIYIN